MKKQALFFSTVLLFTACNSNPAGPKKQIAKKSYFDLQGYFEKEAARLANIHPLVAKTVTVNNTAEHKSLKITDWKKELAIFSDADINKAAWQGLFKVKKDLTQEVYTSDSEKIPVKELKITFKATQITGVQILVKNTNMLYTSIDTLLYYPDSLYQVKKNQHIKLLTEKRYQITGKFK